MIKLGLSIDDDDDAGDDDLPPLEEVKTGAETDPNQGSRALIFSASFGRKSSFLNSLRKCSGIVPNSDIFDENLVEK